MNSGCFPLSAIGSDPLLNVLSLSLKKKNYSEYIHRLLEQMLVLCFNCLKSGHTGFHSDCPLYTPTSNFKGSDSSTPHPHPQSVVLYPCFRCRHDRTLISRLCFRCHHDWILISRLCVCCRHEHPSRYTVTLIWFWFSIPSDPMAIKRVRLASAIESRQAIQKLPVTSALSLTFAPHSKIPHIFAWDC